jgi:predicted metal-dependent HD superfamily phosphohydrolase
MRVHLKPSVSQHPAFEPLIDAGFGRARIEQALAFYDEAHRRYHGRAHVLEMLQAAYATGHALSAAQSLAVLFHDAVYVPGAPRGANERMSAQLLRAYSADLPVAVVDRAASIVLDTTDHCARSREAQLVVDLDLLSLGSAPERFQRLTEAVYDEQRPLWRARGEPTSRHKFEVQRARFFRSLLRRPAIYLTPDLRDRYEAVARANLAPIVEQFRPLH